MNVQQLQIALSTLVTKEIRRFMRIWPQTLLPPAITMSLYFVIFGNLVGSRIGQMNGYSYMQFIVPGLIMMAVITNSYSNVVSSFFSVKFQRSIEELIASPVPNHIILIGYIIGGVTRGLLVGLIVTLLSLFFTELSIHHAFVIIFTVLVNAILLYLGGFINTVYSRYLDYI
jgi:ABC-2 type transport system permease protein